LEREEEKGLVEEKKGVEGVAEEEEKGLVEEKKIKERKREKEREKADRNPKRRK